MPKIIKYNRSLAKVVTAMASQGQPQTVIANALEMDVKTMKKYYEKEYEKGKLNAECEVRKTLYDMAVNHRNVPCLLFYCKTQLGMKETNTLEVNNPDGALSPLDVTFHFIKADGTHDEELEEQYRKK